MNVRYCLCAITGLVYMLTTQFVVHAFGIMDMANMSPVDHSSMVDNGYHVVDDISMTQTPVDTSKSCVTDCITIVKTVSAISTITQSIVILKPYIVPELLVLSGDITSTQGVQLTVADLEPPGRSDFLDQHYGHGVVMHG